MLDNPSFKHITCKTLFRKIGYVVKDSRRTLGGECCPGKQAPFRLQGKAGKKELQGANRKAGSYPPDCPIIWSFAKLRSAIAEVLQAGQVTRRSVS